MENNENLLKKVRWLGYPLFETEEHEDANEILADVVKSENPRLWQGFPVMLANSEERNVFDYNRVLSLLKAPDKRDHFHRLLLVSYVVYKIQNLESAWVSDLQKIFGPADIKDIGKLVNQFVAKEYIQVGSVRLSSEKIKTVFRDYFGKAGSRIENILSVREEFGLEYSLSQIFSPSQKEIILKKLRREKLSKTEAEYFSRTIKKKLLALANPELQRLARQLIE
ncbi:MAG TPA: hypothetical protein VMW46_02350 [Candidatus Desulfaltia sp.]|nr:hypothetical protein [Candidatus Desulfaltia sp.]